MKNSVYFWKPISFDCPKLVGAFPKYEKTPFHLLKMLYKSLSPCRNLTSFFLSVENMLNFYHNYLTILYVENPLWKRTNGLRRSLSVTLARGWEDVCGLLLVDTIGGDLGVVRVSWIFPTLPMNHACFKSIPTLFIICI
jgi:hypothetical protein